MDFIPTKKLKKHPMFHKKGLQLVEPKEKKEALPHIRRNLFNASTVKPTILKTQLSVLNAVKNCEINIKID